MKAFGEKHYGYEVYINNVIWLMLLTPGINAKKKPELRSSESFWEYWFTSSVPKIEYTEPFTSVTEIPFIWGDVYINTDGEFFLTLNATHIAYVKKGYPWNSTTKLMMEKKPFKSDSRLLEMRFKSYELELPLNYVRGRAMALARRLWNKPLPYDYFHCNAGHFMNYILFSEIPECPTAKCPLMRPLDGVKTPKVMLGQFRFKNGSGEDVEGL